MKRIATCLALACLVTLGGPAVAELCTIDDVPAATLLLPYFEVDLDPDDDGVLCNDGGEGITTLFSINNASAAEQLAHVVLFTDLSRLGLDFPVYLTGFDVQTINLRDIFCNGDLPATAIVDQDPSDTISPQGEISGDGNFPGSVGPCANPYVLGPPPQAGPDTAFDDLGQILVEGHLQPFFRGLGSSVFNGECGGAAYGDGVVRGYVTIDNASQCGVESQNFQEYFVDGGNGIATNDNTLWGDYFYVDAANDFAQGETLVHIEADADAFAPGDYTFYKRYTTTGANVPSEDNREPLGTQYATRFLRAESGIFDGGTDIIAWRDGKFATTESFACAGNNVNSAAGPFPLGLTNVVAFDEQENPEDACFVREGNVSPAQEDEIICFPLEAQRVNLDGSIVPGGNTPNVPWVFGWMFLNLNHSAGADDDANEDPTAQSWVTTVMSNEGRFSVGFDAIQLDSACDTEGTSGTTLFSSN